MLICRFIARIGFENGKQRCFSLKARPKTGLLLVNMGGPSNLEEVQPFLTRLFTDRDIIKIPFQKYLGPKIAQRRSPAIREKYAEIGGGSPILKWTTDQGRGICTYLDQHSPNTAPHKFYVGFRYAPPLADQALSEITQDAPKRIVVFSQYAQYSCSTSGSSLNELATLVSRNDQLKNLGITWSVIDRWPLLSGLVHAFADNIEEQLRHVEADGGSRDNAILLFTAHSLPLSVVERGDPYPAEVAATVHAVMKRLNWRYPYRLVWQSKVGPKKWLKPSTDGAIEALASRGQKTIVLVPISFVNEHIETLHELDIEYGKELGEKVGIKRIYRAQTPNLHPEFIRAMGQLVVDHLKSGLKCSSQLWLQCPHCSNSNCWKMRQWLKSL